MASPILVQAHPGKTGLTVDIVDVETDVAIVTGLSVTETNIDSGFYAGTHAGSQSNIHKYFVKQGNRTLANGFIYLKNRAGIRDIGGDTDPEFFRIESGSYIENRHNLANAFEQSHNNFTKLSALVLLEEATVDFVTSQTVFAHTIVVPSNVQHIIGAYAIIYQNDNRHEASVRKIIDYDGGGTYTIESAPEFTLTTNDVFAIVLDKPMTTEFDLLKASEVDLNMGQFLPGVSVSGTTGSALRNSELITFSPATTNILTSLEQILGSTPSAQLFSDSIGSIEIATAAGGILSVTQMTTDLSNTVDDDHYKGRILIFYNR